MNSFWRITVSSLLLAFGVMSFPGATLGKDPKITPEELIENHLASIGTAEARAAVRNRASSGRFVWEVIVGGTGRYSGETVCLSEGGNFHMKGMFDRPDYTGEDMLFYDGDTTVTKGYPDARSLLGSFMYTEKAVFKEGLISGVLNTGWALGRIDEKQPKLKYEGLKKRGKQKYHVLSYKPRRGSSSLKTKLFFEQESFRHVMTVYETVLPSSVRTNPNSNILSVSKFRTTVTETYGNFIELDGLTLPSIWIVRVQLRIATDSIIEEWTSTYSRMAHNIEMTAEEFKAR